MSERVQLKRTKGWRMPPNTVKVDRTTKWGNPFKPGGRYIIGDPSKKPSPFRMLWCQVLDKGFAGTDIETTEQSVAFFRRYVEHRIAIDKKWLAELRGKNLACWCKPGKPCHADVLLEIANREADDAK